MSKIFLTFLFLSTFSWTALSGCDFWVELINKNFADKENPSTNLFYSLLDARCWSTPSQYVSECQPVAKIMLEIVYEAERPKPQAIELYNFNETMKTFIEECVVEDGRRGEDQIIDFTNTNQYCGSSVQDVQERIFATLKFSLKADASLAHDQLARLARNSRCFVQSRDCSDRLHISEMFYSAVDWGMPTGSYNTKVYYFRAVQYLMQACLKSDHPPQPTPPPTPTPPTPTPTPTPPTPTPTPTPPTPTPTPPTPTPGTCKGYLNNLKAMLSKSISGEIDFENSMKEVRKAKQLAKEFSTCVQKDTGSSDLCQEIANEYTEIIVRCVFSSTSKELQKRVTNALETLDEMTEECKL